MDKSKPYLPKERAWYHPTAKEVNKFNKGEEVKLPSPITDDIAVNNIARNLIILKVWLMIKPFKSKTAVA